MRLFSLVSRSEPDSLPFPFFSDLIFFLTMARLLRAQAASFPIRFFFCYRFPEELYGFFPFPAERLFKPLFVKDPFLIPFCVGLSNLGSRLACRFGSLPPPSSFSSFLMSGGEFSALAIFF